MATRYSVFLLKFKGGGGDGTPNPGPAGTPNETVSYNPMIYETQIKEAF